MKSIITSCLIVFFSISTAHASLAGVWSSDCKSNKITKNTIYIVQAYTAGLYQISGVGLYRNYATPPEDITQDPNIQIINDKSMKLINKKLYIRAIGKKAIHFNNVTLTQCTKADAPDYKPVKQSDIHAYLKGEWQPTFKLRMGQRGHINRSSGISDLVINDRQHYRYQSVHGHKAGTYSLHRDVIHFDNNKKHDRKILLITINELHLVYESRPGAGVIVYKRVARPSEQKK